MNDTVSETTRAARVYFAEVWHDVDALPPAILRQVIPELLRQGELLLDLIGDLWYPEPAQGSEQDRLRLGLLAEVPENQRAAEGRDRDDAAAAASLLAAMPGDLAVTVTRWLRAARELGIEVQS